MVESKQANFNLAGKVISFTMDCPHEYAVDRPLVHFDAGARNKTPLSPTEKLPEGPAAPGDTPGKPGRFAG